jgi:hypothetical protein
MASGTIIRFGNVYIMRTAAPGHKQEVRRTVLLRQNMPGASEEVRFNSGRYFVRFVQLPHIA